jgi:hypothetical protein
MFVARCSAGAERVHQTQRAILAGLWNASVHAAT